MKTIYKIILLSLILISTIDLISKNNDQISDTINIKDQIKLIDKNIQSIRKYHRVKSDSSLLLAKQTLELSKKNDYLNGINHSYFYIGVIYNVLNKADSAKLYFLEGLEYQFDKGDLYADILWNLADLYRITGNLSLALEKSLALRTIIENKQTEKYSYNIYNLLGLCYQGIMEYDLAYENYTKSAEIALLKDNKAYAGVIYANIGKLYYDQYKLNEALEYFKQGIKIEEEYKLYASVGNSYNIVADIYLKFNKSELTKIYLEKAKENNLKSNNQRGLASTFYGYGKFHLKNHNVDSAIYYLDKTIDLASKLSSNILLKEAYHTISDIYANKGDYTKAYQYHHLFYDIHNKIYDVKSINKAKAVEYKLSDQENKNKIVALELKKQKTINTLLVIIFSIVAIASIIIIIYLVMYRKLNKELLQSKIKAEESDILKSEFLKTISHEIRTPLNGIIGFTDMIITRDLPKSELKEIHDYIFKNSQDLTSTIENVVDMAHLSTNQYHFIETETKISTLIDKIITQVNDSFLYENSKNIKVEVDLNDEVYLNTDKNILRKIILQLVKNGLKYTDEGKITIGCYKENSSIIFYVKDTGIGIRKDKIDVIFSPFRQVGENTNIKVGGVGLGLTITKEFVALLNGKIWVESEVKKGSTFFISLPQS